MIIPRCAFLGVDCMDRGRSNVLKIYVQKVQDVRAAGCNLEKWARGRPEGEVRKTTLQYKRLHGQAQRKSSAKCSVLSIPMNSIFIFTRSRGIPFSSRTRLILGTYFFGRGGDGRVAFRSSPRAPTRGSMFCPMCFLVLYELQHRRKADCLYGRDVGVLIRTVH